MGRYDFSDRILVENCLCLSIFRLVKELKKEIQRKNPIFSKADVSESLVSILNNAEIKLACGDDMNQTFEIISTPTNLKIGRRYWFICANCRNKVIMLYMPPNNYYFLCRKCHNLTYRSQKEHDTRVSVLLKNPDLLTYHQLNLNMSLSERIVLLKALWIKEQERMEEFFGKQNSSTKEVIFKFDLSSFRKKGI